MDSSNASVLLKDLIPFFRFFAVSGLLCIVLGNVSDIRQTLEIVILSPDYGGIFLSSGENNAIGQRQFVENAEFGGILSQIRI